MDNPLQPMKKWLTLALCLFLAAGCAGQIEEESSQSEGSSLVSSQVSSSSTTTTNEEFSAFLDRFVIEQCESDYTTCHSYFERPREYGIDPSKCDVTLGSFVTDQSDIDETKALLEELREMDDTNLSKINRQIRQALMRNFELGLEMADEKYTYLGNVWSSNNGVPSILTTYFSEYQLFLPEDIPYLIQLIQDVPRFVQEGLEFSQKQAENKTFSIDMDEALKSCETVLKNKKDSAITKELFLEVDGLDMEESEKQKAKDEIEQALNEYFFPAFETIQTGLKALEDQNRPLVGLASLKNGKEYFSLLLKSQSGTEEDIEDLRDEIRTAMDSTTDAYRRLLRKNEEAIIESLDPQTKFENVQELIPFLEERYPAKFPVVDAMNYEIQPLSAEQSQDGVMAYFVRPCVDSTRPYEIRYNVRDYGDDPSSLLLFSTFAHEGVPGHMYQAQYNKEHFVHIAQYFIDNLSFTEGYATYAENEALDWTNIDQDVLEGYRLTNFYPQYTALLMDLQINYDGYSKREFFDVWGEGYEAIYDQLAQNPGVFFSYYYGSLKIMELQTIAKEALGNDYDDVDFNNALLKAGNVEFSIIEENIQDYINSVRTGKYDAEEEPSIKRSSQKNEENSQSNQSSQESSEESKESSNQESSSSSIPEEDWEEME